MTTTQVSYNVNYNHLATVLRPKKSWQPVELKVKLCNKVSNELNRLCNKYQRLNGNAESGIPEISKAMADVMEPEHVTGAEVQRFFSLLVKKTNGKWGLQDVEDLFAKKLHYMSAWRALRLVTAIVIANGGEK